MQKKQVPIISNDNITIEVIWRDGLYLNNDGTYIFASNFFDFLNNFIFNKSFWLTEDGNTSVGKDNCKQSFDSTDEVKRNNSIDYKNYFITHEKVIEKDSVFLCNLREKFVNRLIIGNLIIKSTSSKFDQLKLFIQGKRDILIVPETKLDLIFPTSQFLIYGCSESYHFDRIRNGVGFLFAFGKKYQANY